MTDNTPNKILLFVGPSGSGKTTCIRSLITSMPETFKYVPSVTTRPQRIMATLEFERGILPPEETWAYHFVTDDAFNKYAQENSFVQTTQYNGYQYGTLKESFHVGDRIPTLAVTEDGVQAFIDQGYFPVVLRIDPYNFVPRKGREVADSLRSQLPTSGFSLSHITFDWNQSPHKRKATMLRTLYDRIALLV